MEGKQQYQDRKYPCPEQFFKDPGRTRTRGGSEVGIVPGRTVALHSGTYEIHCRIEDRRGVFSPGITGVKTGLNNSFNLNSFPGLHVMNILGNLAGMISTAFEIPRDHDVVRTP